MTLIILDKKCVDCDSRYYTVTGVDYFVHSKDIIEIHYLNGTRQSWSTNEIAVFTTGA